MQIFILLATCVEVDVSAKKLWLGLAAISILSFGVLGYYGLEIYFQAPPIPDKVVVAENEEALYTEDQIQMGKQVWQAMGGQEVGSVWGHGAYIAPDWSADWLHREAVALLEIFAQERHGQSYEGLSEDDQSLLKGKLQREMRKNTYDKETGTITISPQRKQAIQETASHYKKLFSDDPSLDGLREDYAITSNMVKGEEHLEAITAFFFWTSWAASTVRPGKDITYTQNWPPEKLVGNEPTSEMLLWTGFSVIILLLGIGLLAYYYARENHDLPKEGIPTEDPLLKVKVTPSMQATLKYFWVVSALILVQIGMGIVTAHYGVEGQEFYGFPLSDFLPYSVSRTWHVQLGIFWIATSWLATGLYVSPVVSGHEPKFQRLGVNILFISLLIIVVGSAAGQWASIMHMMGLETSFWFGHQGLEYVDLGRFWQIFLFLGLFIWLGLMTRAIWPALKSGTTEGRHLLILFLISSAAIALFYGAGLFWGRETHYSMVEYWRWWVVHLWVEGFFEVFATVVIAFLFVRMKLLNEKLATDAVLFSTIIFLTGGILGTFHHLYFTGTPVGVMAVGASFSALEVVPLVLIGFEAYQNVKLGKSTEWIKAYRWPIYCFISVAFWNFLGAGIFGFLINPPIALYYMQGLNTTPVHAHTALFGVYGYLGIGLTLFCLKGLGKNLPWNDKMIGFALWTINIGLALMAFLSVLPVGFLQTLASFEHGMWYARSAEFLKSGPMDTLKWLRVIGDTVFAVGAVVLAYFIFGLKGGWSYKK